MLVGRRRSLASCGLRASEAIDLDIKDVTLEDASRHLRIRQTKFHKSRLVPLHPTTADALRTYAHRRHTLGYDGLVCLLFGGYLCLGDMLPNPGRDQLAGACLILNSGDPCGRLMIHAPPRSAAHEREL